MELPIDEEKFYQLIKKAVSEAMEENLIKLKLSIIPYVDDEEMKEIEEIFGDHNDRTRRNHNENQR